MKLSIIAIVLFGTMMLAYTIEAKPARHFATLPRRAAGRVANFFVPECGSPQSQQCVIIKFWIWPTCIFTGGFGSCLSYE